jgi:uncharacterized membrane-anchored protein
MREKGIGDPRLLILIPFVIVISAVILISFTNGVCQTLPESCEYIRGIVYTLIGAMVVGVGFFFKNRFLHKHLLF